MRKYRRITYEDRCQIYALSKRGRARLLSHGGDSDGHESHRKEKFTHSCSF